MCWTEQAPRSEPLKVWKRLFHFISCSIFGSSQVFPEVATTHTNETTSQLSLFRVVFLSYIWERTQTPALWQELDCLDLHIKTTLEINSAYKWFYFISNKISTSDSFLQINFSLAQCAHIWKPPCNLAQGYTFGSLCSRKVQNKNHEGYQKPALRCIRWVAWGGFQSGCLHHVQSKPLLLFFCFQEHWSNVEKMHVCISAFLTPFSMPLPTSSSLKT